MRYYRILPILLVLVLPQVTLADMSLQQLRSFATEVNRRVPMMLDKNTQLDGAEAAEQMLTYKFTLLNVQANKLDIRDFESRMAVQVIKNVCSRLQILIKKGVTIRYYYRDAIGQKITEISVNNSDCGY